MTIAVLGIDLSKNSCSLVGLDVVDWVVLRRRMRREALIILPMRVGQHRASVRENKNMPISEMPSGDKRT